MGTGVAGVNFSRTVGMSTRPIRLGALLLAALSCLTDRVAAQSGTELAGTVTFNGAPVPGVTVTAARNDARAATTTDAQGTYRLRGLEAGTWTVSTAIAGFAPASVEVIVPPTGPVPALTLTLLPFAQITAARPAPGASTAAPGGPTPAAPVGLGGPASANAAQSPTPTQRPPAQAAATAPAAFPNDNADDAPAAADGFLINGSVNNGGASPFAQARAFGNNRPGGRALYTGGVGFLSSHSAIDARPFSFDGGNTPKPNYNDVQFVANIGGPLRLPRVRNDPNAFLGFQRIRDHSTTMQSALVPTAAERAGDFSQSRDRFGQPVQLVDPATGQPFASNALPTGRISPQALALLNYYPLANASAANGFNYQVPIVVGTRQDNVQGRLTQVLNPRQQLIGTGAFQRVETESPNLFSFVDRTNIANTDLSLTWTNRLTQFMFMRARYQFVNAANDVTPNFANRLNVSGAAGIRGNDQDPTNWGPPALSFTSGLAQLSTANYARNTTRTHGANVELFRNRGRHSFTFGGGVRDVSLNVVSQQDPRGGFTFTGAATGSDFGDFLLGLPQSSTIAFGNADKRLQQYLGEAFVNDDWRVSASLTLNLGVRWEFESPFGENLDRLVNLDVAPGFSAVQPIIAGTDGGALSGQSYPSSLLRADTRGIMPRLGVAWRPIAGSSLVIRGGYGTYRNTNVYQSLALLLAQQAPLSTTASIESTPQAPLTLANGFLRAASSRYGTFGVDPGFRVGYAENWQVSAQRDLPASLTVIATYLGSRGHNLMQQFLPNTYPAGSAVVCAGCPTGFAYLTSTGRSLRNAGQVQVRRRLRDGFTASVQYTLAKATDDAAAFAGATLAGFGIAQNWLDLDAEHARSAFDQRHQLVAQAQYSTGAGIAGGALVDGVRGRLLRDWTVVAQLTTGSGLPLTPVYLMPVPGTGFTSTLRPQLTGAPVDDAPDGAYLNPAAYMLPAPGQWGNADRNSVSGPAQFNFNAAVGRTFRWGSRFNVDWRIDATNVLNRVTWASVNSLVGSPQFGLPNRANQTRRLQSSLRMRF
jgi:trimeric autotransporter adhesin